MKPIKVYLRISQVGNCGVGYYRQWRPLKELEKRGLIELRVFDFNWGKKDIIEPYKFNLTVDGQMKDVKYEKQFLKDIDWADIVYITRDECMPFLASHGGLIKMYNNNRPKNEPKKLLIADIDDYVQFTRPHNPGYMSFFPGSDYNTLNFKLMNIVDGVTCSTNYLKKVYKNENKKIKVCPNSLDIKWRNSVLYSPPLVKYKKDEIRIGWAGSSAHYENLKQVQRPLVEILKKYPNVTFHYTGLFGDLFNFPEFGDRIKTVKFVDLKQWAKRLKQMGLDIAIAPLADNNFNRAKSNLRVLEYWAAGYAVIASPVEPYKFIKNNKDGLLAMEEYEWFDSMERMINDVNFRVKLANNGSNRLIEEYNIEKNCMIWYEAFKKFLK